MTTMRSIPKLVGMAITVTAAAGSLLVAPAAAAEPKAEEVRGGWFGALPCPFTSVSPPASSSTVVPFECVSGSMWDGAWAGQTAYRLVGTMDLVSGDIHATLDETLVGMVSATRRPGLLHLAGTVDVDGATDTLVVWERIIGGSGAFAGSSGTVVFDGFQAAAVVGHGGYHGTWTHP